MNRLINQILDLEQQAQKLVSAAEESSRALAADVDKECAAIKTDIQNRQKARLARVEEAETAAAAQQLAKIQKETDGKLASLKALYAEKKEAWVEEITENIKTLKAIR